MVKTIKAPKGAAAKPLKGSSVATKATQLRTNDGEKSLEKLPKIKPKLGIHSGVKETPLAYCDIPSNSPHEAICPEEAETVLDGSGKVAQWYGIPVDLKSDAHMANIVEGNADTAGSGFRKVPARIVHTE